MGGSPESVGGLVMRANAFGAAVAISLCAAAYPAIAAVNLISNGSFEAGTPNDNVSGFDTLNAGNASILGWTIGGDSIDWIGKYWQPANGSRSLDLSGLGLGSVSQTIPVINSQLYTVSFWLAGNPDNDPTVKELGVTTNGSSQTFLFNTTGFDKSNMGWTPESFTFKASGSLETLTFASLNCAGDIANRCAFGPALDNVSVSAVPELSTWGMMLLGFAGISFVAYRRARNASSIRIAA
jgi:choice-of-anchor C domain-containing protein